MLTCGSCGVVDDSVQTCSLCKTEKRYANVCTRCRATHEPVCADIQKMLRRGQGPTVVQHIYIPTAAPQPEPTVIVEDPQVYTQAPEEPPPQSWAPANTYSEAQWAEMKLAALNGTVSLLNPLGLGPFAPESNVDIGLMGVADLLKGE